MAGLFIDKRIEIDAPASKVWEILTKKEYTDQWTTGFSEGVRIESDWKLDSPVIWKDKEKVMVEGNVTKVEPGKVLRYTIFDVGTERFPVTEEDGITFELAENDGKTSLHILHGDFSSMPNGQKYYHTTIGYWDRILPKIKALAEK